MTEVYVILIILMLLLFLITISPVAVPKLADIFQKKEKHS